VLRLALAALHLIALGLGLGAVVARGSALRRLDAPDALRRAFLFDAQWGIAAILWISTGLWRWLGATEKATAYYNQNHLFYSKMGLLALVLALEVWPMVTLMRWRVALGRGAPVAVAQPRTAQRIATISHIQAALIVLMVVLAVAMARGYGMTQ
jgi:putative membrane protein